jgi:hypothetical protein
VGGLRGGLAPSPTPDGAAVLLLVVDRRTRAKMETNKEAEWNPFIQDVKKGKLR